MYRSLPTGTEYRSVPVGTDHITDLPGLGLPKPKTVVTGWHTQLTVLLEHPVSFKANGQLVPGRYRLTDRYRAFFHVYRSFSPTLYISYGSCCIYFVLSFRHLLCADRTWFESGRWRDVKGSPPRCLKHSGDRMCCLS